MFRVICWDGARLEVATSRHFESYEDAVMYAWTIAPSRNPEVVQVKVCPFGRRPTEVHPHRKLNSG